MIFQKTLFYISQTDVNPFHFENDKSWLRRFMDECFKISPKIELHKGKISSRVHYFALLFPSLAEEANFSRAFYIGGGVKEVFKESMRFSKKHQIAFSMTNIHLSRLQDYSKPFEGLRIVSCDIKPHKEARFFDALPEKKKVVPLFHEILAFPKTLSCSGYYGFRDEFKHVQTQYICSDPSIITDVRKILSKYPEHTHLRERYNKEHQIHCLRVREVRSMMPNVFYFDEIKEKIPHELKNGMETPLYL